MKLPEVDVSKIPQSSRKLAVVCLDEAPLSRFRIVCDEALFTCLFTGREWFREGLLAELEKFCARLRHPEVSGSLQ